MAMMPFEAFGDNDVVDEIVQDIKELDKEMINKLICNMGSKEANVYRYRNWSNVE